MRDIHAKTTAFKREAFARLTNKAALPAPVLAACAELRATSRAVMLCCLQTSRIDSYLFSFRARLEPLDRRRIDFFDEPPTKLRDNAPHNHFGLESALALMAFERVLIGEQIARYSARIWIRLRSSMAKCDRF